MTRKRKIHIKIQYLETEQNYDKLLPEFKQVDGEESANVASQSWRIYRAPIT